MQKTSSDTKTNTPQDIRKDFLLEETTNQFIQRFDIEHAFPPGDRPKRKRGIFKRMFDWMRKGQ